MNISIENIRHATDRTSQTIIAGPQVKLGMPKLILYQNGFSAISLIDDAELEYHTIADPIFAIKRALTNIIKLPIKQSIRGILEATLFMLKPRL